MITRPLGKQDYDHIVQIIDRWWGGPTTALAHPIFFYELGSMARVVEHDGILVGFLLGFVAPGPPKTGYVHLVGIHPDYRRRGVGKVLYQTFEEDARAGREAVVEARRCQREQANSQADRHHERVLVTVEVDGGQRAHPAHAPVNVLSSLARRSSSGAGVQSSPCVFRHSFMRSRMALSPTWSAQNIGPPR